MGTGLFITFEGGDGSGKSTQIRRVAHLLTEKGHTVYVTREPGGSEKAEHIRQLLLLKNGPAWDPLTEYLLFSAARRQHIVDVILPRMAAGDIILCDRFIHSSLAYQGYGHGIALSFIQNIYDGISGGLWPDLTFLLNVDPNVGLQRTAKRWTLQQCESDAASRESRFEDMDLAFHKRVHGGFHAMAAADSMRLHVVDGVGDMDEVTNIINQKIQTFLNDRGEKA